jgi:hypothetical protein
MLKLEVYMENLDDVTQLRTIQTGAYYITSGRIADCTLYVRGTFRDVKTRELIFAIGWFTVLDIGYKYITIMVDNQECKAEVIESFDVKIEERR